jgi:methionine-rich copper-binding protein CopC
MAPRAGTWRLVALLWLSAVWLLLSCVPALAHARLLQEVPADGAALGKSPDRVELRFSEPVEAEFSPLEVRNSEGERVDKDNARVDPDDARVLIADLEELPEGSYTVEWRVTSLDGHVVEGRYAFAVTTAGENQPPSDVRGAEGQKVEEHAGHDGHAERGSAVQGGAKDGSVPILLYSALSLGLLAVVAATAFLLSRLARRPRA